MTDGQRFVVHHGDNMAILPTLADCSVDAIVTDPPAGISFMGRAWDSDKGGRDAWIAWLSEVMSECLRVLKPGGHALVWAIPRTSHWTGMAIENAGFEVRDRIAHCFGSGFPKSLDVSKQIDRAAGAQRGEERPHPTNACKGGQWCKCMALDATGRFSPTKHPALTDPATDAARQWQGWGTALKPAIEDWWLARKPLRGNVAANVLAHGTGALNIDECRVPTESGGRPLVKSAAFREDFEYHRNALSQALGTSKAAGETTLGRWPANLILSGEPEVLAAFPQTSGGSGSPTITTRARTMFSQPLGQGVAAIDNYGDTGSAARFFMQCPPDEATSLYYTSKASRSDRDKGNTHSTVKPISLMRYLCRLITPPDGLVLDVFCGSGSTGQAAMFEGFRFIGIEQDAEHVELARHRIGLAARNGWQPGLELEAAA